MSHQHLYGANSLGSARYLSWGFGKHYFAINASKLLFSVRVELGASLNSCLQSRNINAQNEWANKLMNEWRPPLWDLKAVSLFIWDLNWTFTIFAGLPQHILFWSDCVWRAGISWRHSSDLHVYNYVRVCIYMYLSVCVYVHVWCVWTFYTAF